MGGWARFPIHASLPLHDRSRNPSPCTRPLQQSPTPRPRTPIHSLTTPPTAIPKAGPVTPPSESAHVQTPTEPPRGPPPTSSPICTRHCQKTQNRRDASEASRAQISIGEMPLRHLAHRFLSARCLRGISRPDFYRRDASEASRRFPEISTFRVPIIAVTPPARLHVFLCPCAMHATTPRTRNNTTNADPHPYFMCMDRGGVYIYANFERIGHGSDESHSHCKRVRL